MKTIVQILTLCLIIGCDESDNDSDQAIQQGLMLDQVFDISGINRQYHLFVPVNYMNAPLVVLFHGNGSNRDDLLGLTGLKAPYKVWLDLAEQENIILLAPNGTPGSNNQRGWNDCRADASTNPTTDDVMFVSLLLDFIVNNYQADPARIYVLGSSNGGGDFTIRLAQEIPQRITAFASILGANAVDSKCTNSIIPISALIMNGTSDPILPYEGGKWLLTEVRFFRPIVQLDK